MTHTSTGQDRAEFEDWAQSQWRGINLAWIIDFSKYADFDTHAKWLTWQAARRDPVLPQGWKMVPVEPTLEMKRAGMSERHDDLSRSVYQAMLAAAPQPPEASHVQIFSHMEARSNQNSFSNAPMRAVAVDTTGREMPNYRPNTSSTGSKVSE